ncbi:hypothetical protein R3P38DRAFT_3492172 [Favolaschia claudopus]|uniref:Uncharacterized protein n=1 Tax=Favolaschia claudopus TaxID=2862362 RepID=A0AAW0EBH3_9AGAR
MPTDTPVKIAFNALVEDVMILILAYCDVADVVAFSGSPRPEGSLRPKSAGQVFGVKKWTDRVWRWKSEEMGNALGRKEMGFLGDVGLCACEFERRRQSEDLVFACVRQLYVWTFGGRRNLEQVGTGTGTGTLQTSEEHVKFIAQENTGASCRRRPRLPAPRNAKNQVRFSDADTGLMLSYYAMRKTSQHSPTRRRPSADGERIVSTFLRQRGWRRRVFVGRRTAKNQLFNLGGGKGAAPAIVARRNAKNRVRVLWWRWGSGQSSVRTREPDASAPLGGRRKIEFSNFGVRRRREVSRNTLIYMSRKKVEASSRNRANDLELRIQRATRRVGDLGNANSDKQYLNSAFNLKTSSGGRRSRFGHADLDEGAAKGERERAEEVVRGTRRGIVRGREESGELLRQGLIYRRVEMALFV